MSTGISELYTTTKILAIVSCCASFFITATRYRQFKQKIDEQRRERLRDRGIEEADDMRKRELRKQKVFYDQEKQWIKRKQREFKFTIFMRIMIIALLVVLIFNIL
ncbi:MAG: hypothetical protein FWE01_00820 [Firmicutes bacterium]|nr:hypothetical protein [Bacillota bacterium]